ncbi:uncharacterized protein LOC126455811 [Schistocerca serialis cubense]|uniref:uncharacterized protein LOC126455811 n=1 Tax=Schistocerca serialis cubense TaxID=2023355 RepID=UPI00214E1D87|nr:uncharacterized protein LOC126455811 [Schistocerca serialis cubense]
MPPKYYYSSKLMFILHVVLRSQLETGNVQLIAYLRLPVNAVRNACTDTVVVDTDSPARDGNGTERGWLCRDKARRPRALLSLRCRRRHHSLATSASVDMKFAVVVVLVHEIIYDYVAPPQYRFDYAVRDGHTGDAKTQWEHRDGDRVTGAYSLVDADGTTRIVEYTADDHNGFQAVVKRVGHPAPPPPRHHSPGTSTAAVMKFALAVVLVVCAAAAAHHEIIYDYVAPPQYRYDYAVRDGHTGDAKTQWEHRDGDRVTGAYSLVDADGTTRIVEYTADDHNGFQAVVKRVGHPAPPPPQ